MQTSRLSKTADVISGNNWFRTCSRIGLTALLLLMGVPELLCQGLLVRHRGAPVQVEPSAVMQVSSDSLGVLLPLLSRQRGAAISQPANGLLYYQTDDTAGFTYNAGTPAAPRYRRLPSVAPMDPDPTPLSRPRGPVARDESGSFCAQDICLDGNLVLKSNSTPATAGTRLDATSSYAGAATILRSEYTGITVADGYGVYGRYQPAPFYGIGGRFEGGWQGVQGFASTTSSSDWRRGVYGYASGGQSSNYGVGGEAFGPAGSTTYAIFGTASGGATNYAGYFSGNLAYTGTFGQVSDARFKENVTPAENLLPKLIQMKPCTFEFTSKPEYKQMNFAPGKHFGLIAQEVEKIFPELVTDNVHPSIASKDKQAQSDKPITYKGINYMELIPILISAVQSQQSFIQGQQAQIQELQARVNELSNSK